MSLVSLLAFSHLQVSTLATTPDAAKLANRIVQLVNRNDAAALGKMALPEFFDKIPADRFPELIHQLHGMGTLSAPVLLTDLGEQRRYKITITAKEGPSRQILMVLGASSDRNFYLLGMEGFRERTSVTQTVSSDNKGKSQTDKNITDAVEKYVIGHHVDGISIGVIWDAKVVRHNFGKVKSTTAYEIGSITKTMTGYLLAKAVKDRGLNLDQDIRKLLPPGYDNLSYEGKPITFRHLATHSSGLPANPPGIPDDAGAEAYAAYSHEKLLADLKTIKLVLRPGATFGYSNMGAGLCGLLLEKQFGKSYEQLLRDMLFNQLKMSSTGIKVTSAMETVYASPHDAAGKPTPRWEVNGIEAAGAVKSNLDDMLKYAKFVMTSRDPALELQTRLHSVDTVPKTGLFWVLGSSRLGGRFLNHEGGTGGFTSHVLVMPEKGLAVVVMMNTGEQDAGSIAYDIALRQLWNSKLK